MRKLALALALFLAPTLAFGQCTGVFPANTLCGNLSGSPKPPAAFSAGGTIVGPGSSTISALAVWSNALGTQLGNGISSTVVGPYTWREPQTWSNTARFNNPVTVSSTVGISGTTTLSGTANFLGAFQISGSTKTFPSGVVTLGGLSTAQTWTGVNNLSATTNFTGNARFGNVTPWFDVRSGLNGCAAAAGDFTTDDTAAIQCAVNYISNTASANNVGGVVFFPRGTYRITSTITIPTSIILQGAGVGASQINAQTIDINMLHFIANYAGLKDIFVAGSTIISATQPTVLFDTDAQQTTVRDCNIWGGKWALQVKNIDSLFENCFLATTANTGGIVYINGGSNWWRRMKIDTNGATIPYAVLIDKGALVSTQENAFEMSDFSGAFSTASVIISSTNAYTQFSDGTFSSPILLNFHTWTGFSNSKFGAFISTLVNKTSIVASKATVAISATNASCAANYGITC